MGGVVWILPEGREGALSLWIEVSSGIDQVLQIGAHLVSLIQLEGSSSLA